MISPDEATQMALERMRPQIEAIEEKIDDALRYNFDGSRVKVELDFVNDEPLNFVAQKYRENGWKVTTRYDRAIGDSIELEKP